MLADFEYDLLQESSIFRVQLPPVANLNIGNFVYNIMFTYSGSFKQLPYVHYMVCYVKTFRNFINGITIDIYDFIKISNQFAFLKIRIQSKIHTKEKQ